MTAPFEFLNYPFEEIDSTTRYGARFYSTPQGKFPSVTTVLSETADKDFLIKWRERIGNEAADKKSKLSTVIGSESHWIMECLIKGTEPGKTTPLSKLIASRLLKEVKGKLTHVLAIEACLWSSKIRIAGRTDCIGLWDGNLSIIDWKTTQSDYEKSLDQIEDYCIQLAAYTLMLEERLNRKIKTGVIVIAGPNWSRHFVINPHDYDKILLEKIDLYYSKIVDIS